MMRYSKKAAGALALVVIAAVAAGVYVTVFKSASPGASSMRAESMQRYRVGRLELGIAVDPVTPRVGRNRLVIELEDASGKPVSGRPINAYAEMAAMGAMPAMRAPANLEEVAPGRYEGAVDLAMRGAWPLTVDVQDPETGKNAQVTFDLATDRTGLELASGAKPLAEAAGGQSAPGSATTERSASSATTDESLMRFRAGELEIGVAMEPRTPRVGANRLIIEVHGAEGRPASGVNVDAYAEMPAMGAMAAMRAPAALEQTAPGRFEGSVNLAMRGEWPLSVRIEGPQGEQQLKFDLATDREGLSIAAGGVPVGGESSAGAAAESSAENVISVDSRRRQLIGVETGEAAYRELVRPIRAVGQVAYDERLLSHVTLKFDGYIGDLKADYVGAPIERGQVLFTVYSPELLAAQREYLETLKRRGGSGGDSVLGAARQRLRLWDMSDADIEALERRGEPFDYVPIHAPRAGTLIERNIADGSSAPRGQTLLTIADLSSVWIEAQVFEADFELLRAGMPARVTLPYLPDRRFDAVVEYVYPYLEGETRTGRVRLTLDNPDGLLKPDMYAEVNLEADLGERLSVPEEAVIIAGESRVVFVDLGGGRLKPVHVRTGRRAQGRIEITDGLMAGDRVVTSGNFLIAAETRLKTGIEQW